MVFGKNQFPILKYYLKQPNKTWKLLHEIIETLYRCNMKKPPKAGSCSYGIMQNIVQLQFYHHPTLPFTMSPLRFFLDHDIPVEPGRFEYVLYSTSKKRIIQFSQLAWQVTRMRRYSLRGQKAVNLIKSSELLRILPLVMTFKLSKTIFQRHTAIILKYAIYSTSA